VRVSCSAPACMHVTACTPCGALLDTDMCVGCTSNTHSSALSTVPTPTPLAPHKLQHGMVLVGWDEQFRLCDRPSKIILC
jgi:hypothetical protein